MGSHFNVLLKLLFMSGILFVASCREFYDEEFEDDNVSQAQERDRAYSAILTSTDTSLLTLIGESTVDLHEGKVKVDVELGGIPQNIVQVHYSIITADCNALTISIPNEAGVTRNYVISEELSLEALQADLQSSGAATSEGDINLLGKSMIIKGISNFSGIPSPTGTNVINIACGPFVITTRDTDSDDDDGSDDDSETN
jgi:hypothetical protein